MRPPMCIGHRHDARSSIGTRADKGSCIARRQSRIMAGRESGNAQFVERRIIHNTWTELQLSKYAFGMAPTLTTAYWLMKAADAWSQAETTQDQEAKRIKLTIAQGYERLAKHAASLAAADQPEKQKLE